MEFSTHHHGFWDVTDRLSCPACHRFQRDVHLELYSFQVLFRPGWLYVRLQLVVRSSDTKSSADLVLGILFVNMSLRRFHHPFAKLYTGSLFPKPIILASLDVISPSSSS